MSFSLSFLTFCYKYSHYSQTQGTQTSNMQSPSKRSTSSSPSPSPKRPASPAPTARNRGKSLSRRTLRIPRHAAKPANDGSPSHAGKAASPDQDLDVPIRELITLGSVRAGRSRKIRLRLKRKPSGASSSPRSPICLFCLRRFSPRTDLLDHLQTEHSSTEDQVDDHEQGEENGGGDSGGEEEVSSTETEGNDGLDLNQPIEEVHVSSEKTPSGDGTVGGPRKKFRFDLNGLPLPEDDEDEN